MQTPYRNLVSAFVLAGGFIVPASQAAAADPGGYIGFAVGQSRVDIDAGQINAELASLGFGANTSVDQTGTGFKLYGGYQFNPNFAVEGGYTSFGKATSHSVITSGGSGTGDGRWKGYSLDFSAVGILPLNDFSLFGRAGLSFWSLDFDFTASGPGGTISPSESDSGVAPLLAIGAAYNFTPRFALRAEYERHFNVGDDDTTGQSDIDLFTVGLQYRF